MVKSNARFFWPSDYKRLLLVTPYTKGDFDSDYDEWNGTEAIFFMHPVDMIPTLDYDSPEPITSTSDSLPLCKRWLQACYDSHSKCRFTAVRELPTRLLCIKGNIPQLCLSAELGMRVRYATLSHCWGSLQFSTLTSNSSDIFRQAVPPQALPKTFRDAIYIARYLGYFYIWIDSLCILQDDEDDWGRESALMTGVYGGADLNIAASSATDGSEGCFFDRKSNWRCQIPTQCGAGGREALYDVVADKSLSPQAHYVPLHRRAWVTQERYLSRRTLHFFEQQVFWECDGNPACEVFPNGYPQIDRSAFDMSKRPTSCALWPNIVFCYFLGQLTKSSDKLVAVSGLAKLVHAETADEYIARMWRKGLEDQLCWTTLDDASRFTSYTAPTGSWASLQGVVSYPDLIDNENPGRLCIRIHNVELTLTSADPFAGVQSGSLRVICDFLCPGLIACGGEAHINIKLDCSDLHPHTRRRIETYLLPIRLGSGPDHNTSAGLLLEPTGKKTRAISKIRVPSRLSLYGQIHGGMPTGKFLG
ncbi:heterokaryon incompatibility protein-domain-containing protein [Xylaria grammica]|nr:heterokaryon incompatibility protein-domain-containing protein [Xylaria grammica]